MKKTYRICISSPPDRDHLVAEIFFEDVQWAEVNQERGSLDTEFYARPDGQPWRIDYLTAISALNEAKNKLVERNTR